MQKTAFKRRRSRASFIRQNPMRIPYSAQVQLGTSGMNSVPCGGGSMVRGMGSSGSQTSTVTSGHTATVFFSGRRNGLRSMMALYSTLSHSFMCFSSRAVQCSKKRTHWFGKSNTVFRKKTGHSHIAPLETLTIREDRAFSGEGRINEDSEGWKPKSARH